MLNYKVNNSGNCDHSDNHREYPNGDFSLVSGNRGCAERKGVQTPCAEYRKNGAQAEQNSNNLSHTNPHAGAAPAQIEMKTEAAKFPVFCYTVLEGRHTTKHGRVSCSQLYVCKTAY